MLYNITIKIKQNDYRSVDSIKTLYFSTFYKEV